MPEPELPAQAASAVDGHMLDRSRPMTADRAAWPLRRSNAVTDEQDKHFLRIVQDRLRMYSDLEPEDIAKLMLMARRGMKVKNPDRLLVVNKAQAANIVFLDNEVDQLQFRLRAMVKRYDIDHPLRTGDVHDPDCGCMRCERDRAATLLAKGGRL